MRFLPLLLMLLAGMAFGQRVNTLPGDCIRIQDGACIDKDELGTLSGATQNVQETIDDHETRITDIETTPVIEEHPTLGDFPATGAAGTLYLAQDTNTLYRWDSTQYVEVGDGEGTGDVVGPELSIDSHVPLYDGITGKLLKDSLVGIDESGNITTPGTVESGNILINALGLSTKGATNLLLSTGSTTGRISMMRGTRFTAPIYHNHSNDTSSGTAVTLPLPTSKVIRLTAAGDLVSIAGIAAGDTGQEITIMNQTGVPVLVLNQDAGATASDRIITGTEDAIELAPEASLNFVYDVVYQRWYAVGGVGGGLKTQAQSGDEETTTKLEAPHKQLTTTGDKTRLVETNNPNLLENPGFEHQTASSGWTNGSTGSAVVTIAEVTTTDRPAHFGKKSIEVTCNGALVGAGTCRFYQTVATNGSFDYKHSIWAKADTAGKVRAYHVKDQFWTEDTGEGLSVGLDWKDYVFQRVSGPTHSGIGIEITVGAGEIVKVTLDEAVVGYNDPVSEFDQIEDWEVCSVTGTWTVNTTYKCKKKRVGDTLHGYVRAQFSGTPSGSEANLEISIPDGLELDEEKFELTDFTAIGKAYIFSVSLHEGSAVYLTASKRIRGTFGNVNTIDHSSQDPVKLNSLSTTTLSNLGTTEYVDFHFAIPIKGWSSKSKIISRGAELFSTDTHTLSFKSTAITASDPVGTYNTYSYAINSNTKTICGAGQEPSVLPTKADGFKIYTRAYNAASTCGNPARVEIKIAEAGTALPTFQSSIYKGTGKSIAGNLQRFYSGVLQYGAWSNTYDEKTGVYTLDLGASISGITSAYLSFSDVTGEASGYLVINAQPAKTTQAMSLKEFDYVYVKARGAAGSSIPATTLTTLKYTTEVKDSHNSYDPATGIFTAPVNGLYQLSAGGQLVSSSCIIAFRFSDSSYDTDGINQTSGTRCSHTDTVYLVTGETFTPQIYNQGATQNQSTALTPNYISITRIPGQFP